MIFKRGSYWSSLFNGNATKWKCVVKVILKGKDSITEVMAEYNFNSAGNYTKAGGKFWEAKAGEFEDVFNNVNYVPVNAEAFVKKSNRELMGITIAVAVGVLVFFLVFLGLGMLLSEVFGLDTGISYTIGGGIGGGVGGWLSIILQKRLTKSKSAAKSD